MEKVVKSIMIMQDDDGKLFIDVLEDGYNIIDYSIYDNAKARRILKAVNSQYRND